jgi:ATP-dependent DNA helicase PIF1
MTQREALNLLKMGKNVFITGPAGSGKTFVVNEYIEYLRNHHVSVGITASTGIAATHIGGVTIHSWSGIGVKDHLSADDVREISQKSYIKKKITEAEVLIIDEVSMLHHFHLDLVDRIIKSVKKSKEPFGGMQVVLCGDFFQLPPVARRGEPLAQFVYSSRLWKEAGFLVCYLHENFRYLSTSKNDPILSILNEIRSGKVSSQAREQLQSRYRNNLEIVPPVQYMKFGRTEPTRLFTHNVDVDLLNDEALQTVEGPESLYEMYSRGKRPLVEALKRSCLAPEFLRLRKGARVMCVKNNFDAGYVNGTLGTVVSCGPDVKPVIRVSGLRDGTDRNITIEEATWQIVDNDKILAEITQYPLRLAWAITVHKSQGMSLDAIEVDLSKSFEPGMGYVALSRVRTLDGLVIVGMNENALRVHPQVLEHDHYFRELSNRSESIIQYTDEKDIIQTQNEFIAKVAPLHKMRDKAGSRRKKRH